MSDERSDGVWRDEEKLPLEDLSRAMATSANDGQVDDMTGNDAGAEQEFGHDAEVAEKARGDEPYTGDPDPGPTDPDRAVRPSTTGRTGPH
jgi:hypothetical protein